MNKILSDKKTFFLLLAICVLTTVPFLELTEFNTKGEPREAIVASSMIGSGNWILPMDSNGEFAYKPPFFHWCIAAVSELVGGKVSEFSSRFPSAIASVMMLMTGFLFFAKRKDNETAFWATIITFTSFEVHRATFACRVDMMLTACIVCALYSLFKWIEKSCYGIPFTAIILMGIGTLTKGPVAIILPCFVTGVFLLVKGMNFWKVFYKLLIISFASLILPAIWYIMAYQQGGDNFLHLIKEENIDRFTGKMSYESHYNPWTYNVMTVLAGFIPWTLLLLISLFRPYLFKRPKGKVSVWFKNLWIEIKMMDTMRLFSLLSVILIFLFYCIPKSKRSVYLLPIYPFLAYFIAEYIIYLFKNYWKLVKIYGHILAGICLLLFVAFMSIKIGLIPDSIFHGKSAIENISYLHALAEINSLWAWFVVISLVLGFVFWHRKKEKNFIWIMLILIFLSLDTVFQPAILNAKSDLQIARRIEKIVPVDIIDSYVGTKMLHFFTINFYVGNRIRVFNDKTSLQGYLLIGKKDAETFLSPRKDRFYFELCYMSKKRSCDTKQLVCLYRYKRK